MANTTFLTEQYGRHIDLVGSPLRNKDRWMAIGAG